MGFSEYEKLFIKSLLVSEEMLEKEREEHFSEDELQFLRQKDLLRRAKDYAIFPSKYFHPVNKSENIVVHKLLVKNVELYEFMNNLLSEITPPYHCMVDFSFLIKKPTTGEIRFVFAMRSTCLDIIKKVRNTEDAFDLIDEFKGKSHSDFLGIAYDKHKNQACFHESGFNALNLVCAVIFLSKISNLHAPIPFE